MDIDHDAHSIPICTQDVDPTLHSDDLSASESCLSSKSGEENEDETANENAPSQPPIVDPDLSNCNKPISVFQTEVLIPNQANVSTTTFDIDALQEEDNFIKHNSNNASTDGIVDVDSNDPIEDTDGSDDYVLLEFLKSSKSQNRNLTFRSNLVMSFQTSKVKIAPEQHFLPELAANPLIIKLKSFYRKSITYKKSDWRSQECAEILLDLWRLVKLQDELRPTLKDCPSESAPVAALCSFMLPCIKRIDNQEKTKSLTKRKCNLYRDNVRNYQDSILKEDNSKWYKQHSNTS